MEFGDRVWKFYSPGLVEKMPAELALILQLILEGLKALKKDKIEELEKAWEKKRSELLKALESGDSDSVNRILSELQSL